MRKILLIAALPIIFTFIIFRKFFLDGDIPIPADILAGGYYPWLDSSWGYPNKVPVKNNLPSDVFSIIYPWRIMALEIFKQGYLPLWDKSILLGVPLFANFQAALLAPANLLFAVLPLNMAWSVSVILQPILLFSSTYFYLKNLKLSVSSSVLGSLLFAFSGFSLVWLEYNSIVYTLIYFPLILLCVDKLIGKPNVIYSLFISILLTLQFFSGYPLNTIFTVAFASLYFIYRLAFSREKIFTKTFLLLLGFISTLGLSSIQLIPGLEASNLSIRNFDMSAAAGDIKYLPFQHLITFLIPDYFGNPGTQNYISKGSYDNFAFFIPSVGVFLFLLSLVTKVAYRRETFVFLFFCVISLIFATQNVVSVYLESVSLFGLAASVNTRVLFVFCFASSILAAFAYEHLSKGKVNIFQKSVPLAIYILIVGATFYMYKNPGTLPGFDHSLMISLRNSVIPLAAICITFLVVLFSSKKHILLIIPILVVANLHTFDKYLSFTKSELVFPKTSATEELKKLTGTNRFEREKAEIFPSNSWSVYGLRSASGQNAVTPLNTMRYLDLINRGEQNDKLLTRYMHVSSVNSTLFNTLNIETYAFLDRHEKDSIAYKEGRPYPWLVPSKFKEIANIDTVRIYKNTENLGPAWFSPNVICQKDLSKVSKVLTSKEFDAQREIVIDCMQDISNVAKGNASLIGESPNSYEYQVSTPSDNFLVLSQANFPGWKAYVDGVETYINTANITLASVYIKQGNHNLKLVYEPESIKRGLYISVFTIFVWIMIFVAKGYLHIRVKK